MKIKILGLLLLVFSAGCVKPYHEKTLVNINTSEIAILVETVNDNGQAVIAPPTEVNELGDGTTDVEGISQGKNQSAIDYYAKRVVNARKIEVPYYWKQTKRKWFFDGSGNGEWRPAARLIVVDTAPETRKWDTNSDKAIWAESYDSVGFSTGIGVTARIEDQTAAIKFLSNYPPEASRTVDSEGGAVFKVEIAALSQIMDEELQQKVEEFYVEECTAYHMDELRGKKSEILQAVREKVIPFFEDRGITITSLSQFGGFTYENKDVQLAIDAVFQAQQDKQVAKAEADAAQERKLALKLTGEGQGDKILQEKLKEAEGIKAIADAKAYELKLLQENPVEYIKLKTLEIELERVLKWDGKWPVYSFQMGGGLDSPNVPTIMMNTPGPK